MIMEIMRNKYVTRIRKLIKDIPVVAILGPRQCGKTTLARQFIKTSGNTECLFFDCEDPRDLARLENPMLILEKYKGLIVIDEIQRRADLFPVLRVLVDNDKDKKFLILGSASRDLISQSSETLAGRISYLELSGFHVSETGEINLQQLWLRGGFPRSYLAENNEVSAKWREDFIRTFLERDIPNLGIRIPPIMIRRFWTMLSHYHGQICNMSEMGRSLNASDTTVKRYLDILSGTFMIRQVRPWFYNTKKRLLKRPKIYFRDTGILHKLMSVNTLDELYNHPRLGASWEGFAFEQVVLELGLQEEDIYFWAVHTGAELDLVFQRNGRLWGLEFKFSETPKITKSMRIALEELGLNHIWLVYPGADLFPLERHITAVGLAAAQNAFNF
jgi:predicted AAA+ superfamily ATPase